MGQGQKLFEGANPPLKLSLFLFTYYIFFFLEKQYEYYIIGNLLLNQPFYVDIEILII